MLKIMYEAYTGPLTYIALHLLNNGLLIVKSNP